MAIQKVSLVDQVYQHLRSDIISLRYPFGAKLNVSELQEQMQVSCTPIREAINRLQQEGLVVYENNVGARLISLEAHDVEEIQQLALTLHHAAIRFAIARGSQEDIVTELEEHLISYRHVATAQEEVLAVNRFLGVYYHNCGNRRLDNSMLSIQGQQLLLRFMFADCVFERAADAAIFEEMLQATVVGDADRVCDVLQQYTENMTKTLINHLLHREST